MWFRNSRPKGHSIATLVATIAAAAVSARADDAVDVNVHLGTRTPISPYVYGINGDTDVPLTVKWTARRFGGDAQSTYDWENDCNNAGRDYLEFSSKGLARLVPADAPYRGQPASAVRHFHEAALADGAYSLVQVPVLGYVAADDGGTVDKKDAAPSKRWKQVAAAKAAPFVDPPDVSDDKVYVDEFVHHLVTLYGPADGPRGVRGYDLDNEPDLWADTHPLAHPAKTTCRELVAASIATARAIKKVDPHAEVFGPGTGNTMGADNLVNAPDWPAIKAAGHYGCFLEYYLDAFAKASKTDGVRLLDVLDVHEYVDAEVGTAGGQQGILQAPRWFWDPEYHQESWIGEIFPQHTPVIPKLKAMIGKYDPGTRLAITEYNPLLVGDSADPAYVSSGPYRSLALVDELGVFGEQGLYLATYWGLIPQGHVTPAMTQPSQSAFDLYRNYDGHGGTFGDQAVAVDQPAPERLSVHASVDKATNALHVILVGKTRHQAIPVVLNLEGETTKYASGTIWGYDAFNLTLRKIDDVQVQGGRVTLFLPCASAWHLVFQP